MEFSRKSYLEKLISAEGNGMIKIITGIRRCGKSYLLFNIFRKYLSEKGVTNNHVISLAMDDRHNKKLLNPDRLLEYIDAHIIQDGQTNYIIIDEVQMVKEFTSVLLSLLHIPNVETYVSGSNSKFLSKDVATEFRGRGWEIRIRPLSFAEYYEGVGGEKADAIRDYYNYGGLPAVTLLPNDSAKEAYLKELVTTIYIKDIIERNRLHNEEGLLQILRVIASNIGATTNANRIANTFKSVEHLSISTHTISNYLSYLQDAFIISEALRYDIKGRKYIGSESKYYFEDPGIRNAIIGFRQIEYTHMMENVLYNELCARGFSVDIGLIDFREMNEKGQFIRKNLEIDFVVNRGSQRVYIQSAFMLPSREKINQEQRPLLRIDDGFRKMIISGEHTKVHYNEEGICVMGLFEFLLNINSINA